MLVITPTERNPSPSPSEGPNDDEHFRLDPAKFPRRLDLELHPDLLNQLEATASRIGRSLPELITDLLSRHVDPPA